MELKYTCYDFEVHPIEPGVEILIAELGELPFESFEETEKGVKAYIPTKDSKEGLLDEVQILMSNEFEISYSVEDIEQVNWNEEWEKNFEPIMVDNSCYVRAPFHESKPVDYEIVIEPKMSFGTGHHETTYLMLKHLLKMNFEGQKVLDMGCGTAILGILTCMKGAKKMVGIDIDYWCYENAIENCKRNGCEAVEIIEGDVAKLKEQGDFDCIIANINRNILLNDMAQYVQHLVSGGTILFSGFYTEDFEVLNEEAEKNGLKLVDRLEKNNWLALKYTKK